MESFFNKSLVLDKCAFRHLRADKLMHFFPNFPSSDQLTKLFTFAFKNSVKIHS